MDKPWKGYLERAKNHLNLLSISERFGIKQEIRGEIHEQQLDSGNCMEEVTGRPGSPEELGKPHFSRLAVFAGMVVVPALLIFIIAARLAAVFLLICTLVVLINRLPLFRIPYIEDIIIVSENPGLILLACLIVCCGMLLVECARKKR